MEKTSNIPFCIYSSACGAKGRAQHTAMAAWEPGPDERGSSVKSRHEKSAQSINSSLAHTVPLIPECTLKYTHLPWNILTPFFFPAREYRQVCEPWYIAYSCCKSGVVHTIRCAGLVYKAGFMVSPLRSADGFYCDLCLCHGGPYIRIT